ncbi:hypothetical protein TruAng_000035 [Truncatella angustata]|nr:hypothetical protein TruAng_000035 [Truncatella angustata]
MAGLLNGVLPDVSLGLGLGGGDDNGAGATASLAVDTTSASSTSTATKIGKPTRTSAALPDITADPGLALNPAKGVDDPGDFNLSTTTTQGAGNNGNGGGKDNDDGKTAAPDSTTTTKPGSTTTTKPGATEATTPAKTTATAALETTSTKANAAPQSPTTASTAPPTTQATTIQVTTSASSGLPSTLVTSVRPGLESGTSSDLDVTSILPTSLVADPTSLFLATSTPPLPPLAESSTQSEPTSSFISSSFASSSAVGTSIPASNGLTQASTTETATGMTMAATIGISVAGGVGALALIVTSILVCRRYWRKRREANDEALQNLDAMYEKGKPVDWVELDTGRWNKGLEVFHDATRPAELAGESSLSRAGSVRSQRPRAT